MEWMTSNPVLALSLAGAGIALAASLTNTVSSKPPARLVALLAVLGFLVVVAQQLISASLERQSARDQAIAERTRAEIIEEIRGTVHRTEDVVTSISDRLRGAELSDLGEQLVAVEVRGAGVADIRTRNKASADAWHDYARWVSDHRDDPDTRLCLNLELGAGHTYRVDMILGYLLAGPRTADRIANRVEADGWESLAGDAIVDEALLDWPGVDCVLLYDGRSVDGVLVAYAPARDFALELLLKRRTGRTEDTEGLLNRSGPPSADALTAAFASVRTSVLQTGEVEALVRTMIDRRWPECVAVGPDGRFLVSLERVIRAAT